jgi:carbonic anhydrase/acetyltransferase-like protein (isoleucine patch superfamily)
MNNYPLKKLLIPEHTPVLAAGIFLAPGATVVGDVVIGAQSSIWFGSVIRADIHRIIIGTQSNVQDGSVLHVSDAFPCILGDRVTIGHRAVVHACTVEDEVLVGMGAIILDGAVIGARSTIAAGALVTKNTRIPPGSLVMGTPAKVIRPLTEEEQQSNIQLALKYVEVSRRYLAAGPGALVTPASTAV